MATYRVHKSLPMGCLYFFFNRFDFFPMGLLITSILSPFFYIWLLRKKRRFVLEPFLLGLFPFAVINLYDGGMNWKDYLVSFLLLLTIYMTAYAFAVRLPEIRSLDSLVRTLVWINLAVAFLGVAVRFTKWHIYMWQDQTTNGSASGLIRYKGFTYEPAYFAATILPLVLYSYWALIQRKKWANIRLLIAAAIPLIMALSFAVVASVGLGILGTQAVLHRNLRQTKWFVAAGVLALAVFIALPSTSHIKVRVNNVLNGNDASTNAHTVEGYVAAYEIAKKKDIWFGAGIGQSKLYIQSVNTWGQNDPSLNSDVSETLATFGIVGLALRFLIEGFFCLRCRPWKDPFRLSLFIAVFVLQFGDGNLIHLPKYFDWVIAYSITLNPFPMPVPVRRKRLVFRATPQPV
jgi:hypothetical protein